MLYSDLMKTVFCCLLKIHPSFFLLFPNWTIILLHYPSPMWFRKLASWVNSVQANHKSLIDWFRNRHVTQFCPVKGEKKSDEGAWGKFFLLPKKKSKRDGFSFLWILSWASKPPNNSFWINIQTSHSLLSLHCPKYFTSPIDLPKDFWKVKISPNAIT